MCKTCISTHVLTSLTCDGLRQDGLEAGAAVTVEQLIQALQEEGAPAWTRAADHLLRIAGARLFTGCGQPVLSR